MKWGQTEISQWLSEQKVQRSYADDVVKKIEALKSAYNVSEYGQAHGYPVYVVKTRTPNAKLPTVLVTGGVHGYETSGVHGALRFLERMAHDYEAQFNFICVPCVSPWAYETINRWNQKAVDPNRSFVIGGPAEESHLLCQLMADTEIFAHFDLHETTDTDNSVYRPAKEQRDGIVIEWSEIPDGFYVVGDSDNPQPQFQKAVVDEVRKVTHIAQPDANGRMLGDKLEQEGVINYPLKRLRLCTSVTNAKYTTTTEVYPDSPRATPEICIEAQVAAIRGGLNYLLSIQ